VHADLFANQGPFTPRPAWQVIEAARRQFLTGELTLGTSPSTHVYLRDGHIYYAERSTDGGLGVRLLVEGVITRQQMGKGALLVSGVEHLGRMFQRDHSIDRASVELCVELMTDDVLVAIADDVVEHYTMTMYKRHANGIDRWMPDRIEVITHIVEGAHLAEPEAVVTPGGAPRPRVNIVPTATPEPVTADVPVVPAVAQPVVEVPATVVVEVPAAVVAEPVVAEPAAVEPADAPQPVVAQQSVAQSLLSALVHPNVQATAPLPEPAVPSPPSFSLGAWEPITAEQLLAPATQTTPSSSIAPGLAAAAAAGLLDTSAPLTAEPFMTPAPAPINGSDISLAQSAVDAIMSTAIADEVAEAVRRALAAIDAAAQPSPPISPADFHSPAATHAA